MAERAYCAKKNLKMAENSEQLTMARHLMKQCCNDIFNNTEAQQIRHRNTNFKAKNLESFYFLLKYTENLEIFLLPTEAGRELGSDADDYQPRATKDPRMKFEEDDKILACSNLCETPHKLPIA
ncbi:hypothetical protein M5K25_022244 [Dendrobium thyrsiflorum]|uniref:Uncharacterized protein n=1 Tax=Dendrobium thyrsiflorum TaxID=117978 RepID=A0ABD0UBW8_DENTH